MKEPRRDCSSKKLEFALTHTTACSSSDKESLADELSPSSLDIVSYKDALLHKTQSKWATKEDETAAATVLHEEPVESNEKPTKHKHERRVKMSGPRIQTSIIRGAIAHAASQGVLSKSTKREMRQSIMRGETNSILENLRRECHLQPMVTPRPSPPPSEYELRNSNGLVKCINSLAPMQDSEILTNKHVVLLELDRLVDRWIRNHPVHGKGQASLYVGGSWYLKVDSCDSDLDIVVLVPSYISIADFFTEIPKILQASPAIQEINCMEDAYVPTICFKYNSIKVDFLVARFTQPFVPKNLPIHSDHIFAGMDINSVRSLSVPRTASLILELVPNPTTFRTCLRAVRLWAKRRGLYSNKVGFLGGISWTVLVAFVCQLFPNAVVASLYHHFFAVLSSWKWPTPIMLAKPYDAGLGFTQWSPNENVHERAHVMRIITPGYPAMNSAANVTFSTLRVLREEFTRGKLILDDMQLRALTSPLAWTQMFVHSDFAVRYDHYLRLHLQTTSTPSDLHACSSFVASRLRRLVDILQHTNSILTVHPFPCLLEEGDCEGSYFVGFEIRPNASADMNTIVAPVIKFFLATELHRMPFAGRVDITYVPWSNLPSGIFPHGKEWAAGDRAKYMLSRAHNLHMAHVPYM